MKKQNLKERTYKGIIGVMTLFSMTPAFGSQMECNLIKFEALCYEDYRTLSWSSDYEVNTDYFVVEKSDDAVNWNFVENLSAAGNSNTEIAYQITDYSPSNTGYTYFRLTVFGIGGDTLMFVSSNANCEDGEDNPIIIPSPNPTTGTVKIVGPVLGTYGVYSVADRTGHVVDKGVLDLSDPAVDLSGFENGLYFLFIGEGKQPIKIWKQ